MDESAAVANHDKMSWHEMMTRRREYALHPTLCQLRMPCRTFVRSGKRGAARNTKAAGPASENPNDFFFQSELRLYVLHALGWINWVWY